MERINQKVKDVMKYVGIVFIACGAVLFTYAILLTPPPGSLNFLFELMTLPLQYIPAVLVVSVGVGLFIISKEL